MQMIVNVLFQTFFFLFQFCYGNLSYNPLEKTIVDKKKNSSIILQGGNRAADGLLSELLLTSSLQYIAEN